MSRSGLTFQNAMNILYIYFIFLLVLLNVLKMLLLKVLENIKKAQERQKKSFAHRKRKNVKTVSVNLGEEVLISENPMKKRAGLATRHEGPYLLTNLSAKGVATITTGNNQKKQLNVSRLRPYYRPGQTTESKFPLSYIKMLFLILFSQVKEYLLISLLFGVQRPIF